MKDYTSLHEIEKQIKEKFGRKAAEIIAQDLQIEKWDEVDLKGCSPFRAEKTPSFIWNDKDNCFKDFSSGKNYGIVDHYISFYNLPYTKAILELCKLVEIPFDGDTFFSSKKYKGEKLAKDETTKTRDIVESYMKRRGISPKTLDFCNVKESPTGQTAFQFFDEDGVLVSTKYRVSKPAKNGNRKWSWQSGITNHAILYGINRVSHDLPIVIVEGLVDRLAVVEAGFPNVVSIPGGANDDSWIAYNYDFLNSFKEIILWFDNDEPGMEGCAKAAKRLGEYRVKIVTPEKEVEDAVDDYYIPYGTSCRKTDANNILVACGKETVLRLINHAEKIENPRIRKLMEFEERSIDETPHTSTGFKAMDKVFGGVYEGTLTILTGKPGDGKSNILNTMFIISPLESGERVFVYSGELKNTELLSNMMYTFASRRHILRFENQNGPDGYKVTSEASKLIHQVYMDDLYIFDEDKDLGTNSIELYGTIEDAFRRYGCTNFVVDSLLSLDCSKEEGESYFDKEANFVKKLKTFANNFGVKICIVIHSRKGQAGSSEIMEDDINGSSVPVKVCDRAYSIKRLDKVDPEGYTSVMRCIKDRTKGLKGKKIKFKYDKVSRRLYEDVEERDRELSWEHKGNIGYSSGVSKMLVSNIVDFDDEKCEIY